MRIAIAGSSGLIGSALVTSLTGAGHQVVRLVRQPASAPDQIQWAPDSFGIDPTALVGFDAVVNLCGRGIADRRWSGLVKQQLRDSRIIPTQMLAEAVRIAGVPTFVSSSATGYYGNTGSRTVTEQDGAGSGFLAELTTDWEAAALTAQTPGSPTEVTLLRTAPVMSGSGGMLGKLRPLFRAGLGGRLGNGEQYMPWISLLDTVRVLEFVLTRQIAGPINMCAPKSVTNTEFTKALGRAVRRPTLFPVPAFVLSKTAGEMAEEMLLHGQNVVPKVLTDKGFEFRHPTIDSALAYALGKAS